MDFENAYSNSDSVEPINLINEIALDDAKPGDILAAVEQLTSRALEELSWSGSYEEFAQFNEPEALDYGSHLGTSSTESNSKEPVAPKEFHNSLPGILELTRSFSRYVEALEVQLMQHSKHALSRDKEKLLGIPENARGWKDARQMLQEKWNISAQRSKKLQMRADNLAAGPSKLGQAPSAPKLPTVAQKFQAGEITPENIDATNRLIDQLDDYARRTNTDPAELAGVIEEFEPHIAEAAATETVRGFASTTRRWLDQIANALDEDGPAPTDVLNRNKESVVIHEYEDGTIKVIVTTKQLSKEVLLSIMRPMLKRESNRKRKKKGQPSLVEGPDQGWGQDVMDSVVIDGSAESYGLDSQEVVAVDEDGVEYTAEDYTLIDDRDYSKRLHDEFIAMLMSLFTIVSDDNPMPKFRGTPAKLFLTLDYETALAAGKLKVSDNHPEAPFLQAVPDPSDRPERKPLSDEIAARIAKAADEYRDKVDGYRSEGAYGGAIHPLNLRSMLCSAEYIPVVLDSKSRVLELGTSKRLFSPAQIQALMTRDGGCIAPGCTCSAIYAQAHHVKEWHEHNGPTNLDNAVLLCPFHHAEIHAGKYSVEFRDGIPWLIPARWVDPYQKAVRNTIYRPHPLAAA